MDLRSIPAEVHAFESHPSHFSEFSIFLKVLCKNSVLEIIAVFEVPYYKKDEIG